jgi:hypothetical protein
LKEAIKARLGLETWERVAPPIFDGLRQHQRDALVSHVMHEKGFAQMEELYGYFLIDPGMEPVVQTSRIRLAIGSVQLFIQRCLLNLEKDVPPTAIINAQQWEWMKHYRVWEANRKIFLFPENWLEPEFRDDKTHIFSELEGALLQGDVSSDLVEDAFLNYLKKLEELARLDIVAMHFEDKTDPAMNTLHVIGRTFSQPHKYFYRCYAHQMWTPWEPVTAEIEGDHLAPVVWRNRLYLFWVTFRDKPVAETQLGSETGTKPLAETYLSDVMSDLKADGQLKLIDVRLHWSEYVKGEWSTSESSSYVPVTAVVTTYVLIGGILGTMPVPLPTTAPIKVPLDFDYKDVLIHVSKEPYENGEERGVYIHLGAPINQSFYLAGRNSTPEKASYSSAPNNPYNYNAVCATRYSGSGAFKVTFTQRIVTEDGKTPVNSNETRSILQNGRSYTLLPCNNDIEINPPDIESLNTENPAAIVEALKRGRSEIATLTKPVFYQDNANTTFIESTVTEYTIEEWQEWVTSGPQPEMAWEQTDWWQNLAINQFIPESKKPIPEPLEVIRRFPTDPDVCYKVKPRQDWLVNTVSVVDFDGELIDQTGRTGLTTIPSTEVSKTIAEGGMPVNIAPGSGVAVNTTFVNPANNSLYRTSLKQATAKLNIVGRNGYNSALAQNLMRTGHQIKEEMQ